MAWQKGEWSQESQSQSDQKKRLYDYAIQLLSKREMCRSQLVQKLEIYAKKKFSQQSADLEDSEAHSLNCMVNTVIERCVELNFLSDQRFLESFIRAKVSQGYGCKKIEYQLQQLGFEGVDIAVNLDSLAFDWQGSCLYQIEKKAKNKDLSDYKTKQKLIRYGLSRGFGFDQVQQALTEIEKQSDKYIGQ